MRRLGEGIIILGCFLIIDAPISIINNLEWTNAIHQNKRQLFLKEGFVLVKVLFCLIGIHFYFSLSPLL